MGNSTYRQARLSGIGKRLSGIGKCVYRATTSDDRARRRRPVSELPGKPEVGRGSRRIDNDHAKPFAAKPFEGVGKDDKRPVVLDVSWIVR